MSKPGENATNELKKTNFASSSSSDKSQASGRKMVTSAPYQGRFKFISKEDLKVNYYGIVSNFSGYILGRSAEELIANYLEIIRETLLKREHQVKVNDPDIVCNISILERIFDYENSAEKLSKSIEYIPHHFLLGPSIWKLKVELPAMLSMTVRYKPHKESRLSWDFEDNIAEEVNGAYRINYIFAGKGETILWASDLKTVTEMYKLNPKSLKPGVVENLPPSDMIPHKIPADIMKRAETMNAQLPDDRFIVNNILSKLPSPSK